MGKEDSTTPMIKQYLATKADYQDAVLMYRLGDFYEMFFEDAEKCSRILDLQLTARNGGNGTKVPMCGIPYHASESYIAKLLDNNVKVAICEQLTEPTKGKTLVERGVVRVITPGTVIDSALVDQKSSNYLASIYKCEDNIGLSYIDITTGDFYMTELSGSDVISQLNDNLVRIKPSEIVCNNDMKKSEKDLHCIANQYVPDFMEYPSERFDFKESEELLKKQLNTTSLKAFNCATRKYGISSAGALLCYVFETQKRQLQHIHDITYVFSNEYMQLDANTRRNLELTETIRERKKRGSLLWLLDKTETNMGRRVLTNFISQPLFDERKINYRLKGVEELVKNIYQREEIRQSLHCINDIERLCGKISYGNLTAKDCVDLKNSLYRIPEIKQSISKFTSEIFKDIDKNLFDYEPITTLLNNAIIECPPLQFREGGFIKAGYSEEFDELVNISKNGKKIIAQLELKEKEETGIKNLRINFNKVFGYYIEVTNSQKTLVPFRYIRKQTLTNCERYTTEELKELENKIVTADETKSELEMKLFEDLRMKLLEHIFDMQKSAKALSLLDAILSLSLVAVERNYCKPIIDKSGSVIEIIDGRHPVVEAISKDDFVPNDTTLNNSDCRTMIITGPNMAGKSTYMRQVAIITLMAHIGSFVPAKSAKIGLTDRIFTRVGASDDLAFGQSTFMVEMSEVSNILKNATNNSLIILDEVGRGTSTFDGLSIAWSVMEYVSTHLCAKTLFATHYHELTDLEGVLDGVKNFRVSVKEYNNTVVFLRKIVRGGANKSFGIEVASLAGLPQEVIDRAREILKTVENSQINKNMPEFTENDNAKQKMANATKVIQILSDININTLTPLNAFDILVDLKNQIKE